MNERKLRGVGLIWDKVRLTRKGIQRERERERTKAKKKSKEKGVSEKEEEAWNSGRFLGVANEKRRDDHEGYHEPHHPFSHLLFPSRLVPFTLILNPNCPSLPVCALLNLFFLCLICYPCSLSLSLSLPPIFCTYGFNFNFISPHYMYIFYIIFSFPIIYILLARGHDIHKLFCLSNFSGNQLAS